MPTYKAAGVDVEGAEEFVGSIAGSVTASWGPNVVGGFGGFAAGLTIPPGYKNPVLMMSTDGVGTKLEVARIMGDYSGVGWDLVAMCVDDLAAVGARAIGFTDYLAIGQLTPERDKQVVESVAAACSSIGCALLGGETAEHPGVVDPHHLDVAGAALGIVDNGAQITGEAIEVGDAIIGIGSPNVRSNGFSLIRSVFNSFDTPFADRPIGDTLLEPSVIYSPAVLSIAAEGLATGFAHVTGGGLPGNAGRPLRDGLSAGIDTKTWSPPAIFGAIADHGQIANRDMFSTFNMGIGFLVFARQPDAERVIQLLEEANHTAYAIGSVRIDSDPVQLF